ncbi:MAG: transglutaminase domain-containing protein [Aristaeellaceae bacterium]
MEEAFADPAALGRYLARVQEQRLTRVSFRLEADLSLPQMHRALDMLLPMVQRHTRHIRRDRQGYAVTTRLGYRTGVRLADAWRTGDLSRLTAEERLTLAWGEDILRQVPRSLPPEERALRLAGMLAARVRYFSPAPGRSGYAGAVDAAGALVRGQANCQGVSDSMYLLGAMVGLEMGYQAGWNRRGPHLWNTVCLGGAWYFLDVTAALQDPGSIALMDERACHARGLRWERWAETVPVGEKRSILVSG